MSTSANEFPQERVVQGRTDAPTQSGSVQGTPPFEIIEAVLNRIYDKHKSKFFQGENIDRTISIAIALGIVESREALREIFEPKDTA